MRRCSSGKHKKHNLKRSKKSIRLNNRMFVVLTCICALVLALFNINDISAYFISSSSISNQISIEAEYTITFDANTGTGSMASQKLSYNVSTNLNANSFTKTGMIFAGWNTQANGSGTLYRNQQAVNNLGDITLYAIWVAEDAVAEINGTTYPSIQAAINTVTANSGTTTTIRLLKDTKENISISAGKDIIIDFQGYELKNKTTDAVIENKGNLEIQNSNIVMTVKNNGAINNTSGGYLKINGGTIQNTATNGKQAVYNNVGTVDIYGGAEISNMSSLGSNQRAAVDNNSGTMRILDCKIEGKNFDGLKNSSTMIIGTTNDGNMDSTNPVIIGKRYGINAVANFSFYDGIFKGVSGAIDNEAKANVLETGYWILDSTETIGTDTYYTAYLSNDIQVIFDATLGSTSESVRSVSYGDQLGTLPTATHPYKTFLGWYTQQTGGVQADPTQIITSATTFYAHWDDIYVTVYFDGNQGTSSEASRSVILGEPFNSLPTATRSGYSFLGWYTAASDGNEVTTSTIVEAGTTYYAHWTDKYIAQIGNTKYITLQAAIRDVPKNNTQTTVDLLNDTFESVEILNGQNVLLDMHGYTFSHDGTLGISSTENPSINGRLIALDNFGKLTLVGGKITSSAGQATINVESTGELYVSSTVIEATGQRQAIQNDGGYLEISGTATIRAKNTGTSTISHYERGAIQNGSGSTTVIKGGTITSSRGAGIVNEHGSTLIIGVDDGTVDVSTPVITSVRHTIINVPYSTNPEGEVYFYDGILKGKAGTVQGNITGIDANSSRVTSTEVIGGETYYTEYLQSNI